MHFGQFVVVVAAVVVVVVVGVVVVVVVVCPFGEGEVLNARSLDLILRK